MWLSVGHEVRTRGPVTFWVAAVGLSAAAAHPQNHHPLPLGEVLPVGVPCLDSAHHVHAFDDTAEGGKPPSVGIPPTALALKRA